MQKKQKEPHVSALYAAQEATHGVTTKGKESWGGGGGEGGENSEQAPNHPTSARNRKTLSVWFDTVAKF